MFIKLNELLMEVPVYVKKTKKHSTCKNGKKIHLRKPNKKCFSTV